jgi:hypothetical protein
MNDLSIKPIMKKLILLSFFFILSCKSDSEIVTTYQWKSGGGYRLGDFPIFHSGKTLEGLSTENDTIFEDGKAVATIDSVWHHVDHYMLQIKSLDGKTGLYFEKGKK